MLLGVVALAAGPAHADPPSEKARVAPARPASSSDSVQGTTRPPTSGTEPVADAKRTRSERGSEAPKRKMRVHGGDRSSSPSPGGGPIVTFPAFQLLEGGTSRVYVELTGPVSVEKHVLEHALVYTLKGAQVPSRNNRNPLITTAFQGPVDRVRLAVRERDVDVIIELRARVDAAHRMVTDSAGGARLEIDFPALEGEAPPAPTEPARDGTKAELPPRKSPGTTPKH